MPAVNSKMYAAMNVATIVATEEDAKKSSLAWSNMISTRWVLMRNGLGGDNTA